MIELAPELVKDQYGNYVIQCTIEQKLPAINEKLWERFKGSVIELSNEKFSSNAVEKVKWTCSPK